MAYGLLIITLLIIRNLDNSRYGRALYYINKDEITAKSMGINIPYYKLFAFALGAAIAGAAGSIFAVQYSAVSPESFNFMQSVMFFAIVLGWWFCITSWCNYWNICDVCITRTIYRI